MKVAVINAHEVANLGPVADGDLFVRNNGNIITKRVSLPDDNSCIRIPCLQENFSRAQPECRTVAKHIAVANNQCAFTLSTARI